MRLRLALIMLALSASVALAAPLLWMDVVLAAPRQVTFSISQETLLTELAAVHNLSPDQVLLNACTLGLSRLGAAQQDQDATEAVETLGRQTPAQRKEALRKLKTKD